MVRRPPDAQLMGGAADPAPGPWPPSPDRARPGTGRRRSWVRWGGVLLLTLIVGGALGAAVLAGVQAFGTIPPPPIGGNLAAEASSDVILNIRQPYLTRLATQHVALLSSSGGAPGTTIAMENVRVDVLPAQRLRLLGETRIMGLPVQASVLATVRAERGRVQIQVPEQVEVGSFSLPAANVLGGMSLDTLLAQPINAELAHLVEGSGFEVLDVATAEDRLVVRLAATPAAAPAR